MGRLANRIRIHSSFARRKAFVAGGPVEVGIEATNACNISCSMCARAVMKRPIGFMSWNTFINCVHAVKPFAELVWLHGLGEPLLQEKVVDMVAYCKRQGLAPAMSTNALLLDRDLSYKLLKQGLAYIIFPLDGATASVHEAIRPGSDYEKTVRNIKAFLDAKKALNLNPAVIIQMVCQEKNRHEVNELITRWKNEAGVSAVRIKEMIDFSGNRQLRQPTEPLHCYYLWRQHNFLWDGSVSICCSDNEGEISIGNVNEKAYADLWNGKEFQSVRKLHAQGRGAMMALCRRCDTDQPTALAIAGCSLFHDITIKRLLPFIETYWRGSFFCSGNRGDTT